MSFLGVPHNKITLESGKSSKTGTPDSPRTRSRGTRYVLSDGPGSEVRFQESEVSSRRKYLLSLELTILLGLIGFYQQGVGEGLSVPKDEKLRNSVVVRLCTRWDE